MRNLYLFLDDVRFPENVTIIEGLPRIPPGEWNIVRDVNEFKAFIDTHLHEIVHIAFDHDLAEEHYPWNGGVTGDGRPGYDCAKYLVAACMTLQAPLPNYSCHSMNPPGRQNILSYLDNYRRHSST